MFTFKEKSISSAAAFRAARLHIKPGSTGTAHFTCICPRWFCDDLQVALELRSQDLPTGHSRGAGDAAEIHLLLLCHRLLGRQQSDVLVL